VLNFTMRGKVDRSVIPLHGVILLVGPPGTGKTSLARGLAHRTAESFPGGKFRLLEVEPHTLTSSGMGKTQRAVSDLFSQAIAEAATAGPTIVLLDEVETLAADRSKMSLEANPIDIHRATDAVLVQLDILAEKYPNLLFVATSNFPQAVDSAFTSRCDLIVAVPLPDREACGRILKDCLTGLGRTYTAIGKLVSRAAVRPVRRCVRRPRRPSDPQNGGQLHREQSADRDESQPGHDRQHPRGSEGRQGQPHGGRQGPMSTVASRTFRSTPGRDALETWTAIVDLLTKGAASTARTELLAVASVVASVIADQSPKDAAITVTCDGPRTRIYCLYGDDAIDGTDANEDALGYDPLKVCDKGSGRPAPA
jgi:SpoVK/Ycf46/Vps4 family AAA+-type ATPase